MSERKALLDEALEHFVEMIEVPANEKDDKLRQYVRLLVSQALPQVKQAIRDEVALILEELALPPKLALLSEGSSASSGDVERVRVEESYRVLEAQNALKSKLLDQMQETLDQLSQENAELRRDLEEGSQRELQLLQMSEKAAEPLKAISRLFQQQEGEAVKAAVDEWISTKQDGF